MKKLLCILGLLPALALAQPANDDCSTAQNLGTLPTPPDCGTGVVNGTAVTVSTTNVNATAENPYPYSTGCTGTSGTTSIGAYDVWYSFVAPPKGYGATISITSATFANPNIVLLTGTCGNLGSLGCNVGSGGSASLTVASGLVPGTTYYIQVSGNGTQTGTFDLSVNAFQDCSQCLNASHITVSPLPTNGAYAPGTVVNFCYHIDQWTQVSNNWLHGVQLSFGSGWNAASLTTTAPSSPYLSTAANSSIGASSCSSNCGNWAYYPSGITDGQGNTWPAGFYFNGTYTYNTGTGNCTGCGSSTDGNPGNNFGDGYSSSGLVVNPPAGSWNFCWSLTVASGCNPGSDLSVTVGTSGDGESGNWTSAGCSTDPATLFSAIGKCCAPTIATTSTLSCNGGTNGVLTATANIGSSGAQNPYTFEWSNSGGVIATNTVASGTTNSISGLPAGTYTVVITDKNLCNSSGTVTIAQPTAISATLTPTAQTCSAGGSITTSASGGAGGYAYSWSGPSAYTSSSQNPTGLNAGTYTLTITDSQSCTYTTTTTVGSNMTPPSPTASAGPQLTCSVLTTTVNATPGSGVTYSWAGPGIASGGTSATPTVNASGVYTVTVTDNTNGCTAQATTTVAIDNTPPSPTAGAGPQITCSNLTTTVNATPASGVTYSWSGPSVTAGGTSATATVSAAGVYTVTVTDNANGCSAQATTTVTTNNSVPTATATPGAAITCLTSTSTVTGSSNNGSATYSWAGPGIVSGGSTNTATVNASGVYTLTVTDPSTNCTAVTTTTVSIDNAAPNISATAGSPLTCTTNTSTVNGSSTTSGATFSWAGTGIVSGANTATATVNASGDYTLTVTDPANGCMSTATASVSTNGAVPTASTTAGANLDCGTLTTTVSASSSAGSATYSWSGPGIVSGGSTAIATVNAAGVYTVTVTDPSNGCQSVATATISSNSTTPDASASTTAQLTCATNTTTVVGGSTTPGATFSWAGPGLVSGANTATATVNAAGDYTVTVTDPATSCTSTTVTTVLLNNIAPTASATAGSPLTCITSTTTVTGSSASAGATYSWAGPGIVSGGSTATPTVNATGVYTVTVTDPSNGCSAVASATIAINNTPPNVSSTGAQITCSNTTVTISGSSTTAGATFGWAGPGIVSGGSSANADVNASGTYTLTVTDPANGCTNITPVSVTTNTTVPNVSITGTGLLPCGSAATTTISGTSTTAGATYAWTGAGIASGANSSLVTVNAAGSYTLTVTDPANGCTSSTNTTVAAATPPTITGTPVPDSANCGLAVGGIHGLSPSGGTAPIQYNWTDATGATVGTSQNLTNVGPGSYTLTITDANNCTATMGGLLVPGNPVVNAAFTPSPSQGTAPLTVGLTNNTTGATQYLWSFGNGSGATTLNATAVYPAAGTYTVTLIASNGSCMAMDTAVIIVTDATSIIIPNIFSPNGDGINDEFIITTTGMSSLNCDIFNRWGQLVYTLGSVNQSWDGKMNNGNQATEGTYYFILKAVGADGKNYDRQGTITLVK